VKNHTGVKGYGTDAKMALLDYAFNTLGLRRVKWEALVNNRRSIAYSMHSGYIVEGVRKKRSVCGGRYHDRVLLAATPRPGDPISQSGRRIQDSSKVKQYFAKTTEKIWQKNNKRPKVFSLHMVLWESE
jgi:hypothetical protein